MKHGFFHSLRHFGEMVLAMIAGMFLFGPLWHLAGLPLLDRPYVDGLVMATNMTLGMTIYMYYRGHGWRSTHEMAIAMYLPFIIGLSMEWAHVVMLVLMVVAMWRHRAEELTPRPLPARWPTLLALLMTVDFIVNPTAPPPALLMLILPLAYLGFGVFRKQPLALQFVGLAGYVALTAAALLADPETARYLIGAGWLAHAGWDIWHHRYSKVAPKAYAEWCTVFDTVIGLSVIFLM